MNTRRSRKTLSLIDFSPNPGHICSALSSPPNSRHSPLLKELDIRGMNAVIICLNWCCVMIVCLCTITKNMEGRLCRQGFLSFASMAAQCSIWPLGPHATAMSVPLHSRALKNQSAMLGARLFDSRPDEPMVADNRIQNTDAHVCELEDLRQPLFVGFWLPNAWDGRTALPGS